MEIKLSCKDFDSWVSFLGRLDKLGGGYIIKNDIILPTIKGNKSGSNDKIPGRHLTRDPLFINDTSCYVQDGIYYMIESPKYWQDIFKAVGETNKLARKEIYYIREKTGIYVRFGNNAGIFQVYKLLTQDDIGEKFEAIINSANGISWFDDFIKGVVDSGRHWVDISHEDLIRLRNDGIMSIGQEVDDKIVVSRIARSLFTMAYAGRMDNPIALSSEYTFLPSDTSDIAIMRLHANYKPAKDSKLVKIECIHEYLVLIYNIGKDE